jgi:hypothetical protein
MATSTNGRKITRDDLESAFAEVIGETEATTERSMPNLIVVGAAALIGVIAIAYLFGRRRGRSRSAVVEVRRI